MLIYSEFKTIEELSSGREPYPNYRMKDIDDSIEEDFDDDLPLED